MHIVLEIWTMYLVIGFVYEDISIKKELKKCFQN